MTTQDYTGTARPITFKTVLVWAFGVLTIGFSLLLLTAFYDFITLYASALAFTFLVTLRVLLGFFVAYIGFMLFLSFEYKAIQNERFKKHNIELLSEASDTADDKENLVLEAYNRLTSSGTFSLNQLALAVYGKKGGSYNAELRAILNNHDIEI